MAKTVLISEDSIIAMLRGLPENALIHIFSKMLIQSDSSPLTDEEETSYRKALEEHEKGEIINWEDLRYSFLGKPPSSTESCQRDTRAWSTLLFLE
jgi:hypothetical protein